MDADRVLSRHDETTDDVVGHGRGTPGDDATGHDTDDGSRVAG